MRFCDSLSFLLRIAAVRTVFFCCCLGLAAASSGHAEGPPATGSKAAAAKDPVKEKDTLTLTSGEQLIGKLVKETGGNITFQSDGLGTVTIPIAKVKTMHASPFAVVAKGEKIRRRTAKEEVAAGTVVIENGEVMLTPAVVIGTSAESAAATASALGSSKPPAQSAQATAVAKNSTDVRTIPLKNLETIVDTRSLTRELQGERSFLYGWTGSVTLGTTIVNATNSSQTYTGSIAAVRTIPSVPWTTLMSKTSLNASGTYGLAKDPEIDSGSTIIQYPSVTKTDILHGDAEYDRYLSPRFFWLVNASADHNFGNGLQLQQAYGGGAGWTLIQKPNETFSMKMGLQYLEQQFYNGIYSSLGTPNENLVGLGLTENWSRNFAHNLKFT
ncbi:MAG TPA: DUF481 domain-containing protein, partial [Acidobacteriaceae bacterium]